VLKIAMGIIFVLVVEFVVKLIRMALHTRLQKIQLPPIMDEIILMTIDGLRHGATNEPIAFMLKDQVESNVGSWKKMLQSEHYR